VQFEVEDTGVGIYPEDLPHLFERFYRGRRDQVADVPGTGLGLVIVKELINLHGGTICVHSEVGAGSTFTVTLPAAPTGEK
jgi:two-component system sensor histidine kinase BaeS